MASRVETFVEQFVAVNDALIATVEGCSDAQWRVRCEEGGRTVGVVAFHVGATNEAFAGMLGALAAGQGYTPNVSMEEIHRQNAEQAREHAAVGKAAVAADLRRHGAAIVATMRGLGDDDLAKVAGTFGGNQLTIGQVIEYVVVGHTREHLDSIRAAL